MTTRTRSRAGFSRPVFGNNGARRRTAWDDELFSVNVPVGTPQSALLLAQNVADPEKRGCTLVRIIYHMYYQANAPGAVNGTMSIDVGIGLASDDAFSAGALPEASVAADFPSSGWLYRDRVIVMDSIDAQDQAPVEIYRDLRVQRKLERSSLYAMHELGSRLGTSFNVNVMGIIRVLYKLP